MRSKSLRFKIADILYLIIAIVPIIAGIVLNVLTKPASEGISITGARIFFTIPMPIQDLPITEAQINSWLVIISILGICLYMAHGVSVNVETKRQHLAEWDTKLRSK